MSDWTKWTKETTVGHNSLFVLSREKELPHCESFPSHANCKYMYFAVAPTPSAIKVQCYSNLYSSYNSLRILNFEKNAFREAALV